MPVTCKVGDDGNLTYHHEDYTRCDYCGTWVDNNTGEPYQGQFTCGHEDDPDRYVLSHCKKYEILEAQSYHAPLNQSACGILLGDPRMNYEETDEFYYTQDQKTGIITRVPISQSAFKDTNPKDAVGSRKARWFSYVPLRVLVGVGLAMLEGARKYGRHNYRVAGVRASVYVDAAAGHIMSWFEGEDIDPDSGLSHIDKAIASLIVLRDGMYEGNFVDDRAPSVKDWPEFMATANAKAVEIIDRYPDAVPAFIKK
jgi:hypothetical protein